MTSRITLGMLKPDAIARNLDEEIYKRITLAGLSIYKKKRVRLTQREIDKIYGHNKGKQFYPNFIKYMKIDDSEPFLATLFDGSDAIQRLNLLVGDVYPERAQKGTIRGDLAIKYFFKECPGTIQNLIHSTLNKNKAIMEVKLFFPEELSYFMSLLYTE